MAQVKTNVEKCKTIHAMVNKRLMKYAEVPFTVQYDAQTGGLWLTFPGDTGRGQAAESTFVHYCHTKTFTAKAVLYVVQENSYPTRYLVTPVADALHRIKTGMEAGWEVQHRLMPM